MAPGRLRLRLPRMQDVRRNDYDVTNSIQVSSRVHRLRLRSVTCLHA